MKNLSQPRSDRTPTEQERFWQGDFGSEYTARNQITPEQRQPFFERILKLASGGVQSVCELGANRGHNLLAIQRIQPDCQLTGVEINPDAVAELSTLAGIQVVHSAIQDFEPVGPNDQQFDLVYSCGVLIHLNPDDLPAVYGKMFDLSRRYILINEYYNPVPVELGYRGHEGKLFKRDFGGEFMDANAGRVRVVDYGFLWQRLEPAWDNTTWWLFEKI